LALLKERLELAEVEQLHCQSGFLRGLRAATKERNRSGKNGFAFMRAGGETGERRKEEESLNERGLG